MSEMEEEKTEPIQAWVMLAGLSGLTFLLIGQVLAYGLIYVELLDVYQEGPIRTTLITVVFSVFLAVMGPVSGYLGDRFTARVMVVATGFAACAGLVACSLAPNVTVLIFTYGVVMGCCDGTGYTNTLATLNRSFKRNRVLANGITMAMGGLGTIVLPVLFQYLIEKYSVRGLFLVLAGMWLNLCVAGALIRPQNVDKSIRKGDNSSRLFYPGSTYGAYFHPDLLQRSGGKSYNIEEHEKKAVTRSYVKEKISPQVISISVISINQSRDQLSSAASPIPNDFNSGLEQSTPCSNVELPKETAESDKTTINNMLKSVFSFQMASLLLVDFLANSSYSCTLMFLPAFLTESGYEPTTATMCLSIAGGMDVTSKLVFGILGDRSCLDLRTLLAICHSLAGVAMCLISSKQPVVYMIVWCIVLGTFSLVHAVFRGPLLATYIRHEYIGIGYGLFALDFGLATAFGQLMFSTIRETTGTYTIAFVCAGCFMFLSAATSLITRICRPVLKTHDN